MFLVVTQQWCRMRVCCRQVYMHANTYTSVYMLQYCIQCTNSSLSWYWPSYSLVPTTGPVTVKLWQPRHVKRTRRDLSELDVCLTLYDEVVREAMWVTSRISIIMLSSHEISKCACKSTSPEVNVWSTTGWSSWPDIYLRGCGVEVVDLTFTSGGCGHTCTLIHWSSLCRFVFSRVLNFHSWSRLGNLFKIKICSIGENFIYVCL